MWASPNQRYLMLGVDDTPSNLKLLRGIVEAGGYRFVGAASGREALVMLRQISVPKVIILDVMMPNMDGIETCREIRKEPSLKATPVIFLTALKTKEDVTACLAAGGNDFVIKPVEPQKMLERLEFWVKRGIEAHPVAAAG